MTLERIIVVKDRFRDGKDKESGANKRRIKIPKAIQVVNSKRYFLKNFTKKFFSTPFLILYTALKMRNIAIEMMVGLVISREKYGSNGIFTSFIR